MKKIVLAGNPNVGKSTIFNALTGMKQHTGNWPGKTVGNAIGNFSYKDNDFEIYDLPGTYSLISHSEEETIARDFLCYEQNDLVIVVCDALCLERNMNLVLQILEITPKVVLVVNLMDEATKKHITIDLKLLQKRLGIPVIGTSAHNKKSLVKLLEVINNENNTYNPIYVKYNQHIEEAINSLSEIFSGYHINNLSHRWLAMKLIDHDDIICKDIDKFLNIKLSDSTQIKEIINNLNQKFTVNNMKDYIVSKIMENAETILKGVVTYENNNYDKKSRKLDSILTSKLTGIPIMIILLMFIFWITIVGANYPSEILYNLLFKLEDPLLDLFTFFHAPNWLSGLIVSGSYRTLAWVVSVMFPPMLIFFPLFTILEDFGYLPRIAFNLDRCFKKCQACGKQALTMCMGFGCNAVGVTGCRIIDSKRERLIAILTNSFVPCNGRFPTIIALISMFMISTNSKYSNIMKVSLLTLFIILGILMTFLVSKILSKTILKGKPSSFTLELPPYRKPQLFKVIIHSIFDKALNILLRAVVVSIPAGIIIWLLANININNISLLSHFSSFLDPFGKIIGLDGVIIAAFILGFPANEIVIPIMIMSYMSLGNIVSFSNLNELKLLLINNGWTILTAINTIIFSLFHFPCSTTCLTIKKETGSWKWVGLSIILPLICGIIICLLVSIIYNIINFPLL